ncbi:hypothetical protein SPHS6_01812 [Sphingobium sp. S6]|nr:hypothetical protein SPHS6_01812 [Sphingobium sp. S6]CAD7338826.1 hypothetical protein SPHS8_02300 [Sphingobium sp. S8]
MDHDQNECPTNETEIVKKASPKPQPPTEKERKQIADAQEKAEKDQEELRSAGFGDHKGTEGF